MYGCVCFSESVHIGEGTADKWLKKDKIERWGSKGTQAPGTFLCMPSFTTIVPWGRLYTNPWPPLVLGLIEFREALFGLGIEKGQSSNCSWFLEGLGGQTRKARPLNG